MKKTVKKQGISFNISNEHKTIVASSLICGTVLFSGCHYVQETSPSVSTNPIINDYSTQPSSYSVITESTSSESTELNNQTESITTESTEESIMNATEVNDMYSDIEWESSVDGRMFAAYLNSQYNIDYLLFVEFYGNSKMLEQYLAEYYNSKKGTDYSTIPFSAIKYDKAYRVSGYGQNYGDFYNEKDHDFYVKLTNINFFENRFFSRGIFDVPEVYLYNIMNFRPIDFIYPLEEIQCYSENFIKNIEDVKEMDKYYNVTTPLSDNSEVFAWYLSGVDSLNVLMNHNFKIISLENDGSQEYKDKIEFMNEMFHDHFLSKYGIDYEFHVDQPLDASFIDDVLIPAFGEDKVKEAEENIKRLEEEARAKQSEAPQKETQQTRSR